MEVLIFALYYVLVVVAIFLKRDYFQTYIKENGCADVGLTFSRLSKNCTCAYLNPIDESHYVSIYISRVLSNQKCDQKSRIIILEKTGPHNHRNHCRAIYRSININNA